MRNMNRRNFFKWLKAKLRFRSGKKQWKSIISPEFKADLEALPKKAQKEIRETMDRIMKSPYAGVPVVDLKSRTMTPEAFPLILKKPVVLQMTEEDEMLFGTNEEISLIVAAHDHEKFDEAFYTDMEALITCYFNRDPSRMSEQSKKITEVLKTILTDDAMSKEYKFRCL